MCYVDPEIHWPIWIRIQSGSEALLSWHDLIDMFVQGLEKKFGLEPGIIPEEEMPPEPAVCYSVN
jgi:hypothetical protein